MSIEWSWRRAKLVLAAALLLAGVAGVGRARAALPSNCAQQGNDVTCKFSFTNAPDQTFKVPAGVSSVKVVAVGAPGGAAGPRFPSPTPGGAGAVASGTVSVAGGQTLYVEVGGAGDAGFTDSAGGFNGGGPGDTAPGCGCPGSGGGGGASDVRTAPYSQFGVLTMDPRLLIAGGGGGAGAAANPPTVRGGAGGAAGQQGLGGTPVGSLGAGGGGLPGSTSLTENGGTGGAGGDIGGAMGSSGGRGGGGGGSTNGGGGGAGGGGLYGGGQGGEGAGDSNSGTLAAGGGGGGGSSLVPAGGSVSANTTGLAPQVTISYTAPQDSTSSAVSCSPTEVVVGQPTTCTATVTDTGNGQSTPTGTVRFGANPTGSGSFSANSCMLHAGTGATARCAVSYTPSRRGTGSLTIAAGYAGDSTHQSSSDHAELTIGLAPAAPTITSLDNGDGQVAVSFSDSDPGTSPITSYQVTATDVTHPAAPPATAKGPSSPVTVKGLTNGDTYVFTVTATSADGTSPPSAQSGRLNVGLPPNIQGGPANGVVGHAYSSGFTITGAPAPTVTQVSGQLPPGLTLHDDGTLTGTPTQAGSYEFTVEAVNPVGIYYASVPVTISPATLGGPPPKVKGRRVHARICPRHPKHGKGKPAACSHRTLIGTFPPLRAKATATLVRGRVIYATGHVSAHYHELTLRRRRNIHAGRYTLILRRPHHAIFVAVVLR
jgi:Fibronectin type III domain